MYKAKHFPDSNVINWSKKTLTEKQKEVLKKGVKFGLSSKKVPI
jgi:predicted DNA binding protein